MRTVIFLMFLLALPLLAFGQVADPGVDPAGWTGDLFKFVTSKQWSFALGAVLVLIIHLVRKLPNPLGWGWVEWLKTNRWGGWLVSAVVSVGTALSGALFAKQPITLWLIIGALGGVLTTAGGLEFAKDTKIIKKP